MKKTFLIFIFSFFLLTLTYGEYYIQAGVFNDRASAVNQQSYLASRNYPVTLNTNDRYKVMVGPFEEKAVADCNICKLLAEDNISGTIIDETAAEKITLTDNENIEVSDEVFGELVNVAFDFLGVNYKYGGMNVDKGIDCSYFVQTIYSSLGTVLPRTSRLQFKIGKKVKRGELAPGDLVFFKKHVNSSQISHVGMYIGNGEFIHASSGAKKVTISSLDETYFKQRFVGARRPL